MKLNELLERDGLARCKNKGQPLEVWETIQTPTEEQMEGYKRELAAAGFGLAWKRYKNGNLSTQVAKLGRSIPFAKWPHELDKSYGEPV